MSPVSPVSGQSHPALELVARYRAVFRAAWTQRLELAGPRRLADEAAFLPAALSLQDTPVHPAPRRLAWVIIMLFVITLAWATLVYDPAANKVHVLSDKRGTAQRLADRFVAVAPDHDLSIRERRAQRDGGMVLSLSRCGPASPRRAPPSACLIRFLHRYTAPVTIPPGWTKRASSSCTVDGEKAAISVKCGSAARALSHSISTLRRARIRPNSEKCSRRASTLPA